MDSLRGGKAGAAARRPSRDGAAASALAGGGAVGGLWARAVRRSDGCTLRQALGLAGLVRLALLLYGEWQDAHFSLKYTDIDYVVFTDAARFMVDDTSPFQRATYRYTPLLAALLQPNIWLHAGCGKVGLRARAMAR